MLKVNTSLVATKRYRGLRHLRHLATPRFSRCRTHREEIRSMTDPMIARANEILERLFALDEEIANGRALRALLEDLHARDLSVVAGPHVETITIVRAGI